MKFYTYFFTLLTCLMGILPVQAGSDMFPGLFPRLAKSPKVVAPIAAVPAVATVPVAPAVTSAVAATSMAAAVGIGLGSAIATPLLGTLIGAIYAKRNSSPGSCPTGVASGVIAVLTGFAAGCVASPFIAGALATGLTPSLVAVGADAALKCGVFGLIYGFATYKKVDTGGYAPILGVGLLSCAAAALGCVYGK